MRTHRAAPGKAQEGNGAAGGQSVGPLAGVRVLDLTDGMGGLCARFLGDLGADVILVEPPGGGRSRTMPPVIAGRGLYHLTHNANKRAIELDLAAPEDRGVFWSLLATADIAIEPGPGGGLDELGLGPDVLRERHPALVVVSISDFGRSGPYRDWSGSEHVHLALAGVLARSGLPGLPPLLPPGSPARESAAIQAAWAALLAYFQRLRTGKGDHADVSVFEAAVQVLDPAFGMGGSAAGGEPAGSGSRGRPDARHRYPIFECADGWVRICVLSARQWAGMYRWLGEPAELSDPALGQLGARFATADRILPAIAELFAPRTREQLVADGQRHGVPIAPLLTPAEVLEAEHFRTRQALTAIAAGPESVIRMPNGLVEVDGHRAGLYRPAPSAGQHTREVLAELRQAETHLRQSWAAGPDGQDRERAALPLAGLRVIDLGVIVVGAELGRLLADMGAEVIKVENQAFPDGSRQSLDGSAMTVSFACGHRNKLSLGLNLRDERGKELFRQLVKASDVVLSNFRPGTLESLGLGYADLVTVNSGIVMADSSAFGTTGPWSRQLGYGPLVRAATGLTWLWRYPDVPGSFSDASTIYPDHIAARVGAVAVLAKLIERRATGRGGTVSVAQAETILTQLATQIGAASVHLGSAQSAGNELESDCPRGVFPCAGDDEWAVISIRGDRDWAALAQVIGRPGLAGQSGYDSAAGRRANRQAIDAMVAAWSRTLQPEQVMHQLQTAGVPAGMMRRASDLAADPHLVARRQWVLMRHPLLPEPFPAERAPAIFAELPDPPLRPAPLPGEHTRQLAAEVLGLAPSEIDELIAAGVLERWAGDRTDPVAAAATAR